MSTQADHYDDSGYLKVNVVAGGAGGGHVDGTVAHDAADADYPVKIGGKAATADRAAVSDADRVDALFDKIGRLIVAMCLPENILNPAPITLTDQTSTDLFAAAGAGVRNHATSIMVTNSHASVDTQVQILDGTTVIWQGWARHDGGGFAVPCLLRSTANTAIKAKCVTSGANVVVSGCGFKGA